MSPRDARIGAVPEADLARLDSDLHHVRDQADLDRRSEAAFRLETRRSLDLITATQATTAAQLLRMTDLANRLDVSVTSSASTLTAVCAELAEQRGALKVVAGLAVVVMPIIMEVARHVFK
jgi:hypothetical protein